MNETTPQEEAAETAQEEPAETGITRICARCSGIRRVTALGYVEQQAGPGWTVWGCDDCAPALRKLLG